MIIHLTKSKLFTHDPDVRFARKYKTSEGLLNLLYTRQKVLDYSIEELCEFYFLKTGRRAVGQTISRWLWKMEIYKLAQPVLEKGAESVLSSYFGPYEMDLVNELLKNITEHPAIKTLP